MCNRPQNKRAVRLAQQETARTEGLEHLRRWAAEIGKNRVPPSPTLTDFAHVLAILADLLPTEPPRCRSFRRRKLVGAALLMRFAPCTARYLSMLLGVHQCKSSSLLFRHLITVINQ
jgi:hypothetical protein